MIEYSYGIFCHPEPVLYGCLLLQAKLWLVSQTLAPLKIFLSDRMEAFSVAGVLV